MNTKKEIVEFLEEIIIALQGKRDNYERKIGNCPKGIVNHYQMSLEHTKGQLYEANYILETITRDRRKKD